MVFTFIVNPSFIDMTSQVMIGHALEGGMTSQVKPLMIGNVLEGSLSWSSVLLICYNDGVERIHRYCLLW